MTIKSQWVESSQSPNSVTFSGAMNLIYDFVLMPPGLSDKPWDPEQIATGLAFQKDPHTGPWTLGGLHYPDTVYIGWHTQNSHVVHFAVSKFSCVNILLIEMKQCLPWFCGKSCTRVGGSHTMTFPAYVQDPLLYVSHCNAHQGESQQLSNFGEMLKYISEMVHSHCCQDVWEVTTVIAGTVTDYSHSSHHKPILNTH